MAGVKREASTTPAVVPTPQRTASAALQHSIALLSSSRDIPPTVYAELLASLSDAVSLVADYDDRERNRKRVKVEDELDVKPVVVAPDAPVAAQQPPMPSVWGLLHVSGQLSEVERMILRDVEAGQPLLDKLGILLRPVKGDDGKISLLEWEAVWSAPADSTWRGMLFTPTVVFTSGYPSTPPKVKLSPAFFHPNVYPSGTICAAWPTAEQLSPACGHEIAEMYQGYQLEGGVGSRRGRDDDGPDAAVLPPQLRLPLILEAHRRIIAYEDTEDPAQLEGYTVAKKTPDVYRERVRAIVASLVPTFAPGDYEQLAEARRRAAWRTANGQDRPLLP